MSCCIRIMRLEANTASALNACPVLFYAVGNTFLYFFVRYGVTAAENNFVTSFCVRRWVCLLRAINGKSGRKEGLKLSAKSE